MKIRTDFVTNSSSSCFCVQLLLQFDNQDALYMDANSQEGDPDAWETFDECKIIHAFSGKGLYTYNLARNFAELIRYREDLPNLFRIASDMASVGLKASVVEQVCSTATKLNHAYLVAHADVQGEYSYVGETYSMLGIDVKNAYVDTRSEEENLQMLKDAGLEPLGDEALEELVQGQADDENGGRYGLSKTIGIHMKPDGSVSADIYYGSCENMLRGIRISPEHDIAALERYPVRLKAACKAGKSLQDMIEAAQKSIHPDDYVPQREYNEITENLDRSAVVTFADKHFMLSGFGDDAEELIADIEKRGGIIHSRMVKIADYLVVCLESPSSANIKKLLSWRNNGVHTLIISDYQLVDAVTQTKPLNSKELRRLQNERRLQEEREKENARLAKLEREKKQEERRKKAEERRRIAQEAYAKQEEERRKRKEMAQSIAEEKQRLREAREKAKAERERAAFEARAQKERERQEAVANAVILYAPGQEPENVRKRIRILCEKLDKTYPNRVISGLYKDHKNWGETVTELRRILGYPDNTSLLEAYGYTVETSDNKGGRPTTVNPDEVIAELKRRYPNGAGPVHIAILRDDNPDLPWKTLDNNAKAYFGRPLAVHLKSIGLIGGDEIHAPILEKNRDQQQDREETEEVRPDPIKPIENSSPADIQPFEQQNLGLTDADLAILFGLSQDEISCLRTIEIYKRNGLSLPRDVDIANFLGVSQACASDMMSKLRKTGLLSADPASDSTSPDGE